jgi:hypothetical protein
MGDIEPDCTTNKSSKNRQYDIHLVVKWNDGMVVTTLLKASARKHFLFGCQWLIIRYICNFTFIYEYCFLEPPLRQRNFKMLLPTHLREVSFTPTLYFITILSRVRIFKFRRIVSSTNLGAEGAHNIWSISSPLPQTRGLFKLGKSLFYFRKENKVQPTSRWCFLPSTHPVFFI